MSPCDSRLPDSELICRFESLGINCEFGFVQRLLGADPLGLLRFAGMPFDALIHALRTRFAGVADSDKFRLWLDGDEYRISVDALGLSYHTQQHVGEIDRDQLYRIEHRKTRFLISQLIGDLEKQRKIFVYHQQNAMPPENVEALLQALASYGPVCLLWVIEANAEQPPGSVVRIGDRLLVGHVARLAPSDSVHEPHLPSWLEVCREAYRLWTSTAGAAAEPAAVEIDFGAEGNARQYQLAGWSTPETHHCWTTGRETQLRLPRTPGRELMLGLQLFPYVNPAQVAAQRLAVIVNGTEVAEFTVKTPSYLRCPVPLAVLERQDSVDVLFRHPDATSPSAYPAYNTDTRELAFAFQRVSLHWTHGQGA